MCLLPNGIEIGKHLRHNTVEMWRDSFADIDARERGHQQSILPDGNLIFVSEG